MTETTTEALNRLQRAIDHSRAIASGEHICKPDCPEVGSGSDREDMITEPNPIAEGELIHLGDFTTHYDKKDFHASTIRWDPADSVAIHWDPAFSDPSYGVTYPTPWEPTDVEFSCARCQVSSYGANGNVRYLSVDVVEYRCDGCSDE